MTMSCCLPVDDHVLERSYPPLDQALHDDKDKAKNDKKAENPASDGSSAYTMREIVNADGKISRSTMSIRTKRKQLKKWGVQ